MTQKTFVRLLCAIIVIVILLPTVIACKKEEIPEESDSQDVSTSQESDGNAPTPYMDDFGGYEFKVLTRKGGTFESNDITADLTGSVVDQAVYQRNARLKQEYNFQIVETKESNYVDVAKAQGSSGAHVYDMWSFAMDGMASLAQEGYLYNLNEVKGLNLDAPYYDQNTRENASFANYLFVLTGDMLTADDISTNITLMNKELYETYKLEEIYGDIYDVVMDGKWTFEKMKTYASKAYGDDDGDGIMTAKDRWAGSCQKGHLGNFYIAFGHDVLKKTSDDTFVLNEDPELISKLQELIEYLRGPSHYWKNDFGDLYTKGNQLFWYCQIAHVNKVRAAGVENIMLPNPKYDEEQDDYYTYVPCGGSNCITICSTVKNVDLVASIIELTSYESMDTVTPALMEYLLGGRIIDNARDAEVLEKILDTRTYAYNSFWNTGGIVGALGVQLEAGSTDIAHCFAAARTEVNASVQRKLERLQRLG